MAVLIEGMEMPKNCHECRLYEGDIYYCSAADKEIDILDSSEGKCQFCPLVSIPEPHGRLVDADALIEAMARMVPLAIADPTANTFLDGLSAAYEAIQAAPTIIDAEKGET